ncbi:MAG: hypothetical protein AAF809_14265 [Bacteroidota bacterium]
MRTHFAASPVLTGSPARDVALTARCERGQLRFDRADLASLGEASYIASALATFVRKKLLDANASFTFETVMSHESKLDLLDRARACGYRTYLYFVAIDDPRVNVQRVENRVRLGGHAVPENKVIDRYERSLALLREAIKRTDRAYLIDNSRRTVERVATFTRTPDGGHDVAFTGETVPYWVAKALPELV